MPVITLPTWLTLARIALTPLFAVSLYRQHAGEALFLFFIACITDTFDGILARRLQQKSDLGALLDALADKILLTVAYIMMSIFPGDMPNTIPVWLAVLIIGRDLLIVLGGWWMRTRISEVSIPPSHWGKWSTTLQMAVVVLALAGNAWGRPIPLFSLAVLGATALTLISGLHYGRRAALLLSRKKFPARDGSKPTVR